MIEQITLNPEVRKKSSVKGHTEDNYKRSIDIKNLTYTDTSPVQEENAMQSYRGSDMKFLMVSSTPVFSSFFFLWVERI